MVKKTVIPCSGGLDSVGLLWQLLNDTDEEIFVQHVRHNGNLNHWKSEEEAFLKCIDYIKERCRPFTVLPIMEYAALGESEYRITPCVSGGIATVLNDADRMVIATVDVKFQNSSDFMQQKTLAAKEIYNTFIQDENINRETPIRDFDKREWFKILPEALIELTTTCKLPTLENGKWLPCGTCNSCVSFDRAKAGLEPKTMTTNDRSKFRYVHNPIFATLTQENVTLFVPSLEQDNLLYLWNLLVSTRRKIFIQPIEIIELEEPTKEREALKNVMDFLIKSTRYFDILPPVKYFVNVELTSRLKELARAFCVGHTAYTYKDQVGEVVASYPTDEKLRKDCEHIFDVSCVINFKAKNALWDNETQRPLPYSIKEILNQYQNTK